MTAPVHAAIEKLQVNFDYVRKLAAERAAAPYREPDRELPQKLAALNYDQNREIRFRPDQALWRKEELPFQLHLFHRTSAVREAVQIREFSPTHMQTIPFIRDFYNYGGLGDLGWMRSSMGYAGFRIHYPVNRPDVYDELIAFQGASYFRALGANQIYGLSARGLAVDSGVSGKIEEFPVFTDFWIGKPQPGAKTLTIYALLDSARAAGAYEFIVRPGNDTVIDVRVELNFRAKVDLPGYAPLTSMFWYGKNSNRPAGDPRPEVHDSDGLMLQSADGTRLWRPLQNPSEIVNTDLRSSKPVRFGLVQRDRTITHYEDFEARYHERPSVFIEPMGDWGAGAVRLVELPTHNEYGDNIVAFWVPSKKPGPDKPVSFAYRMTWALDQPSDDGLARVYSTRTGNLPSGGAGRLFWIDFAGADLGKRDPANLAVQFELGPGARIRHQTLIRHSGIDGWRVALQVEPDGTQVEAGKTAKPIELRCRLRDGYQPISETWVYSWIP